ncbi:hypothetical protein DCC39_14590 [Pueribacillus theae]|uniref:Uncharacterized protein n=1 Tax=Pueribacillus theae TaxID=2171751 RepID=A0A2U1JV12_9BACI|nr:tape measure protein [Pueribacillus theae]PWA08663.1 hypothetical protein DCC39_14590 [Pueribacillus theae]
MTERIKGLSIGLDLDTLKVERGLTGLKDRLKTVNSEMKLNMSAFDRSKQSVEKYQTRLDGLNKKLEVQKEVTKAAKEHYEDMIKEHGLGSKEAEKAAREYNNQAAALKNLERYVDGVTQEFKEFQKQQKIQSSTLYKTGDSLVKFGSGLKSISDKTKDLGKNLTKKLTLPAVGAASALAGIALKKGFDRLVGIDNARAKLKGLGHDAKGVEKIMDSALESVKGTSFGMDEAATTAANAVAAGVKEGKELTRYLSLTGDAAAIAGASMSEMGSILNKVQTSNKAYNGELRQLADRGLPVYVWLEEEAKKAGMTVEEMASKGMISSEMLMNAIEKNIGGAAKKMGEESFTAGIANAWAAVGRLGASFLDAGGKGGGFFSQLKPLVADFTDRIDSMGGIAEKAGVKFGEMFTGLIDKVKSVKSWFDNLSPSMQNIIKKGALIGGAITVGIGPALSVLGTFGGFVAKVSTNVGELSKSIAEAGGFLKWLRLGFTALTGPVGITIGILTLLATGFIVLYKRSETFREGVGNLIGKLKELGGKALAGLKTGIGAVISFFKEQGKVLQDFWKQNGDSIIQAISNIGKIVGAVFNGIWKAIQFVMPAVLAIIKSVWGNIKGVISGALKIIMGLVQVFSGLFTGDFKKMWEGVKNIFFGAIKVVWNWIQLQFIGKILKGVGGLVKSFGGFIKQMWTGAKTTFSNGISVVWNWMKNSFAGRIISNVINFVKNFRQNISNLWQRVKEIFLKKITEVRTSVTNSFIGRIISSIFNFAKNFRQNISNMWQLVKSNFTNKISEIRTAISNSFVGKMLSSVRNLKTNFINLAKEMWTGVKKQFNNIVDGAKGLPKRIGDGIRNAKSKAADGMKSVGNSIIKWAGKPFNKVVDGVNWITGKLGIKSKIGKWDYPQYAKGTEKDGHKGGLAMIGEKGRELVRLPDGRSFISPDHHTILDLPKGTHVIPNKPTEQIIKGKMPQYAGGTGLWDSIKDVWSYITNPSKLVKKVMDKISIAKNLAQIPNKIVSAGFNYLKTKPVDFIKKKLGEFTSNVPSAGGGVQRWAGVATRALMMTGQFSPANLKRLLYQMKTESGGNPRAINLWDINAKRGTPSKGLMQVIDPTFQAYKMPGFNNIWNPLDNILASIRYAVARYGSLARAYRGVGYETGGLIKNTGLYKLAEGGWPEYVIPTDPSRRTDAMKLLALAGKEISGNKRPHQLPNVGTNNDDSVLRKLLAATMEQNEILKQLLAKNPDLYMDSEKVGKAVEPAVTKQQQRKQSRKRRVPGFA